MTGTPLPPVTTTTGLEYRLSKDGNPHPPCNNPPCPPNYGSAKPLTWSTVSFNNLPEPIVINGFQVDVLYYIETSTPNPDTGVPTISRTYPTWTLIEQTLEQIVPGHSVFTTEVGDELYASTPETFGNVAIAGITNNKEYSYTAVFDEANIQYLPRCSPNEQQFISKPQRVPTDPDEYPIDALSAFLPDEREEVNIVYRLTTRYSAGVGEVVDVVNITHPCTQDLSDVKGKLKAYLDKCYYTHGKYHNQLYDLNQQPLYNDKGELIRARQLREPIYDGTRLVNSVSDFSLPVQTGQKIPNEVRRPDD